MLNKSIARQRYSILDAVTHLFLRSKHHIFQP
jgi:hypothetical protein